MLIKSARNELIAAEKLPGTETQTVAVAHCLSFDCPCTDMTDNRIQVFQSQGQELRRPRRRHEETVQVELSKAGNDENERSAKRCRIEDDETDATTQESVTASPQTPVTPDPIGDGPEIIASTMSEMFNKIHRDDDEQLQLGACQMARQILCHAAVGKKIKNNEKVVIAITAIIQSGIVPKCVHLLDSPNGSIRMEALWIISNIVGGNSSQINYVAQLGVIHCLLGMVYAQQPKLFTKALWTLGSIARGDKKLRDQIYTESIVRNLIQSAILGDNSTEVLRSIAWLVSNLCEGKNNSQPDSPVIQLLAKLIKSEDTKTLSCGSWGIAYLTEGSNLLMLQGIFRARILSRVIQLFNTRPESSIISPCLHIIGDFVATSGNAFEFTSRALASGPIPKLMQLLTSPKTSISINSAWAISSIAAGSDHHKNAVLNCCDLIPSVISTVRNGSRKAKTYAVTALANIAQSQLVEHIQLLCGRDCGVVPLFCDLLKDKTPDTILIALKSLKNILETLAHDSKTEVEKIVKLVEECSGLQMLDKLQNHANEELSDLALEIVESYFGEID